MWPFRTFFYFGVFWAACILSIANPIWGVVNYLMVYQMNPVDTWWGKPIAHFGIRYSLYAVGFTILGMLVGRRRVPKVRPWLSAWEIGLLTLLGIAAVNLSFDINQIEAAYDIHYRTGPSGYAFEKFWKMLVFVLILARLVVTRKNLHIVIWAFVGGSLYLGYDAYTANPDSFTHGRLEHIGGFDFATTSGFAAHLSAMLPLIGIAFLIARKWRWKAMAALAGGLTVNAIIMCRTRSAFIGLIIGSLAAFLLAPRAKRYRIHALLIAGAAIAFTLTDSKFWDRMATMTSQEALAQDSAAELRFAIWKTSFQIVADHPYGIGLGNFPRAIGMYEWGLHKRSAHNTLILAFVELGICGGFIFLALVAGSLWFAIRSSRLAHLTDQPLETKLIAYGMLVSCVTYVTTGLGTERFMCESFWWVLVLPLCLHRMVLCETNAQREVPALVEQYAIGDEMGVVEGIQHV